MRFYNAKGAMGGALCSFLIKGGPFMEGLDRTIIEGGDGFGGASMLAGGAGFVGALDIRSKG